VLGLAGNAWLPFLKQLRRPEGHAPKQIANHQFYMQHPDFRQKVLDKYAADYADTPKNKCLMVQCEITQTLLEAEGEEVKALIRKEAEAEHAALLEAHNSELEGLPSVNEVDCER
jgi:hypothetical protein